MSDAAMGPALQGLTADAAFSGRGNPFVWPHALGHPGIFTQRVPVGWLLCLDRWQQDPLADLQQAMLQLQPSSCAKSINPAKNGITRAAVRRHVASRRRKWRGSRHTRAHSFSLMRFSFTELER
jgi:hypothetical protein